MKKIIYLLFLSVSLMACSSDDTAPNVFDSHIFINGSAYTPRKNAGGVNSIRTQAQHVAGQRSRNFIMSTYSGVGDLSPSSLVVRIYYPESQSSINGTYGFDGAAFSTGRFAAGNYGQGPNTAYAFDSGAVTVTHLGQNRYKLEFDNIHGLFAPTSWEVLVTGYFDGTFAEE